jgi:hypothetical protein
MTLFAWLCLAHLVGDWMLQNDWMARNKGHNPAGSACLIHCSIYTAAVSGVYLAAADQQPALAWRLLLFASFVFCSHWIIDGWRLAERWGALIGQTPGPPVRTVVDQTMHILVLALAVSI